MLKLILLGVLTTSLFAVTIQIKKADVTASLNSKEAVLKKGDRQAVEEGTIICYVEGKGKIIIPEIKRQLVEVGQCLTVPILENSTKSYVESLKNMVNVVFWDSSESVRHGSGTKGKVEFDSGDKITLAKDQQTLIIYSKEFGPLPVVALLKDNRGKEVARYENSESDITLFRISKEQITDKMTLEISNGFGNILVKKSIVTEDQ